MFGREYKINVGSDVEKGDDNRIGWHGIISNMDRPNLSARLVKDGSITEHRIIEPAYKYETDARIGNVK